MKVQIENEKIYAYMVVNKLNEGTLACDCELTVNQAKVLLSKKVCKIDPKIIIRFCNNTGFKFSSVFTVLEYDEDEQVRLNVLKKYYDGNDRMTDVKIDKKIAKN